jgi:hypothetical protein
MTTGKPIMTAPGTAPDIPHLEKPKILIMISNKIGSDILNGIMMIQAAIMTKTIIEPDIPGDIKTKRSCLAIPGTGRDIKNEMEMLHESWWFMRCCCS